MQLRKLFEMDDERAVSPVIGVILMVAITVILAAVIGTFVLGLGDQVQETSPSTQWSWSTTDGDVTLTHDGGDSVNAEQLSLRGSAFNDDSVDELDDLTTSPVEFSDDRVTAGDSIEIIGNSGGAGYELDDSEDGEIRIIWTSDGGGQSSTLSTYNYQP